MLDYMLNLGTDLGRNILNASSCLQVMSGFAIHRVPNTKWKDCPAIKTEDIKMSFLKGRSK